MSGMVDVGAAADLAPGSMKEVAVEKRRLVVARVGDRYYAAEGRCPHMGGSLARGTLEGTVVTCPRHGSRFDLSDGQVVRWLKPSGLLSTIGRALKSPRPLVTYRVKVEDGRMKVELPS